MRAFAAWLRHYRSALITGPTGTGKDLVAKALHNLSPASSGRFVTCNCSAVVETLFESELFGYVKGAFTGANTDKMGLMEFAHGGTLFLDEIGDMPLTTQAKLLRVLQNQEITRVGSVTPRKVDVRVIAATNRDVREMIAQKQFREDLYYRLAMVELRTLLPSPIARKICHCSKSSYWTASPHNSTSRSPASRGARRFNSRGIPGPAISANWKTSWDTPA